MRIKFVKPFRFIGNAPDDGSDSTVPVGRVVDLENDESTKWLIDNGFAEKVKESGWWKPRLGERYYYFGSDGEVYNNQWENDSLDNARLKLDSVFKTEEATKRWRDYLKAIATVSHDEGFMPKNGGGFGWPVIEYTTNNPGVDDIAGRQHAGEFYFDTREHALNSAMNHTREWQTILNYDWSRE